MPSIEMLVSERALVTNLREFLSHIRDMAIENTKGLDGYDQIAEWADKALALTPDQYT
jgi:hypothetical protein